MNNRGGRATVFLVSTIGAALLVLVEVFAKQLEELLELSPSARIRLEIGVLAGVILIVINLVFHLITIQSEAAVSQLTEVREALDAASGFDQGRVRLLTSEALYRELRTAAQQSKSRIYTSYMGGRPGWKAPVESKRKYFELMDELPRRAPGITIRRIVLGTKANLDWIGHLVDTYRSVPNVSLAVYLANPTSALPLSMQLFDSQRCFLVGAANRPPGQARDIAIVSEAAAGVLDAYYELVWATSTLVVDSGGVSKDALDDVKAKAT